MVSVLGYKIWEYFTCFFDYIPKIMYFLYAALASCLDVLQCLMRRLAGLDIHYINGEAITNSDPVLSFIMGILGIGENAGDYSVLTTTFWSLAIFGLIVLALTTFVAIIKSHYSEDAGKTSPVQYIYTAFKSILTFAIVPLVVIAGFWLSSFLLQTLDNITAGAATEEKLQGIYGSNYDSVFDYKINSNGNKVYSRYDFFGFGEGSTSETFSGLIFKVSANGANRLRTGSLKVGGIYDFGIMGQFTPSGENRTEWTAYQIDYAFANSLKLKTATHAAAIYAGNKDFITIASIDTFVMTGYTWTFSKYNVGLVWAYYNLWQFNFLVGFASIITCFFLMISIIMGLMTRLIKSIALFLIYPAILGIAPLDDWGAFKKWRGEFQQQVLMAFGAILGMNLFFLILPYLDNIKFFNIGLLDYMVNIVIVITGLVMVKGFIGFMSGLVGGADAVAAGDGVKSEVGKTLASGAKMTLGAANIAMKAGKFVTPMGLGVNAAQKGLRYGLAKSRSGSVDEKAKAEQARVDNIDNLLYGDAADVAQRNVSMAQDRLNSDTLAYLDTAKGKEALRKAQRMAKAQGLTDEDASKFIDGRMQEEMLKDDSFGTEDERKARARAKKLIDRKGYSEKDWEEIQKRDSYEANAKEYTARAKAIRESNYLTVDPETGKTTLVPKAAAQATANDARALAGSLVKGLENGLKELKLNPAALIGIFSSATNYKLNDKGKLDGVYGEPKTAMTTKAEIDENAKNRKANIGRFASSLAGVTLGYGSVAKKNPTEKTGDALGQEQLRESKKSTEAIADLNKKIDKLTEAILKKSK